MGCSVVFLLLHLVRSANPHKLFLLSWPTPTHSRALSWTFSALLLLASTYKRGNAVPVILCLACLLNIMSSNYIYFTVNDSFSIFLTADISSLDENLRQVTLTNKTVYSVEKTIYIYVYIYSRYNSLGRIHPDVYTSIYPYIIF